MSKYTICTDCDVCGNITMVREVEGGGTSCRSCDEKFPECPSCEGSGCDDCVDDDDYCPDCGEHETACVCYLQDWEDDGQPTLYEEYQDLYGGDDWNHGQYDEY